jgi:hypothetical protein
MTAAEFAAQSSNESIQLNLLMVPTRRALLRMAPWACGMKGLNLVYITSAPGTPENPIAATTLWQPGQPIPPWNYEYQYPVDCIRACWMIPATQTGFAGGIPITTAVTGGAASFWQGPPVKYQIMTDTYYPVTAAAVVGGGTGYAIGDIITLAGTPANASPIGAPAQVQVLTLTGSAVATVAVVNSVAGTNTSASGTTETIGGSYFAQQTNPVAQGSTTGVGAGATFNLTFGAAAPQRVVLTNQEYATLVYIQDVLDPNLMDDQFQEAYVKLLAAQVSMALTGDKKLANIRIQEANQVIMVARVGDGNEGFTVNDVTPDWIRVRGVDFATPYSGPNTGFDFGGMWPIYG